MFHLWLRLISTHLDHSLHKNGRKWATFTISTHFQNVTATNGLCSSILRSLFRSSVHFCSSLLLSKQNVGSRKLGSFDELLDAFHSSSAWTIQKWAWNVQHLPNYGTNHSGRFTQEPACSWPRNLILTCTKFYETNSWWFDWFSVN